MTRSQFYDSSRSEICCTDSIGRVPLRIIGGISLSLSIIQIILNSTVNSCSQVTTFLNIRNGAWWSGLICFATSVLCILSTNRGVVIAANILSIVSVAFGFFAVYYDRSGITYLQSASTTQGYCEQLLAAGFIFDIVMIICSLSLFAVSFLSLLCPGCFKEQTYESVLRQDRIKKQREERQKGLWENDEEQGHNDEDMNNTNTNNSNNCDGENDCEDSKDYSEKSADGQALYSAAYGSSSRKVYMPSRNGDFEDVTTGTK